MQLKMITTSDKISYKVDSKAFKLKRTTSLKRSSLWIYINYLTLFRVSQIPAIYMAPSALSYKP